MSATHARRTGSWELRSASAPLGFVLRFLADEAPPRTYFVIRNREHQDLGLVDALGRAWRYRPHERDPEWLSTGTVLQGARAILGLHEDVELIEIPDNPEPKPGR